MPWTVLNYAFRPFFLLNSLFAALIMILWILALSGRSLPGDLLAVSSLWHGHEMMFGFAGAAIAGFVMTAVATWTGRAPVRGSLLAWLVLSWLAGRLAILFSGFMPGALVALIDLSFPLLLCGLISRELHASASRRNYPIAVIIGLVAVLNLGYHLGAMGVFPGLDRTSLYLMVHLVLILITVISGRIIPNFTANWLRAQGETDLPRSVGWIERLIIPITVLTGVAATLDPMGAMTGILALAAGMAHGRRLTQWRGLATLSEPLLFVLHAAYFWLPVGYILMALSAFGLLFPPTAALHALTMGGVGGMILAVSTRVALAHTGRALHASRLTTLAYAVLGMAVVCRVLAPLTELGGDSLMNISALGWIFSFGCFFWVYWPVLTHPRIDGREG